MKAPKTLFLAAAFFLSLPLLAQAASARDCVLEGTVKKRSANSDKVYVAFHSAKPAKKGSRCRFRRNEKLQFKTPASTELGDATPGSRVEYRYTENENQEPHWKLRKVSNS